MERIKQIVTKYGALILIFIICLGIRGCMDVYKGMTRQAAPAATEAAPADNGSFVVGVPGTIYSDDGRLYAEQSLEKDAADDVNFVKVTVYSAENDLPVGEFLADRAMDFHGVCFEPGSYNIWVQSGDAGVYCMRYDEGRWVEDREIERPGSIVSKYDKPASTPAHDGP